MGVEWNAVSLEVYDSCLVLSEVTSSLEALALFVMYLSTTAFTSDVEFLPYTYTFVIIRLLRVTNDSACGLGTWVFFVITVHEILASLAYTILLLQPDQYN